MRLRQSTVWLCLAVLGACAQDDGKRQVNNRDTMTQRQKDSVLGATRIPGASNIPKAQRAADSLSARARALDTIR